MACLSVLFKVSAYRPTKKPTSFQQKFRYFRFTLFFSSSFYKIEQTRIFEYLPYKKLTFFLNFSSFRSHLKQYSNIYIFLINWNMCHCIFPSFLPISCCLAKWHILQKFAKKKYYAQYIRRCLFSPPHYHHPKKNLVMIILCFKALQNKKKYSFLPRSCCIFIKSDLITISPTTTVVQTPKNWHIFIFKDTIFSSPTPPTLHTSPNTEHSSVIIVIIIHSHIRSLSSWNILKMFERARERERKNCLIFLFYLFVMIWRQ